MQLLPMASSPEGLISARDAVITKTPGWGVLTTTSNRGGGGWGGGNLCPSPRRPKKLSGRWCPSCLFLIVHRWCGLGGPEGAGGGGGLWPDPSDFCKWLLRV